jgi:hypothetical protein
MAALMRRYLEGIVVAVFVISPGLLRRKLLIWVSRIGRWRRVAPFSLLGASFLERMLARGALRRSGVVFSAPTTV